MLLRHATFQDLQAIALSRGFSLTGQEEKWAFTDLLTGGRDGGVGRYPLLWHLGQQSMPIVAQVRAAWCHAQGKTVGETADLAKLLGVAFPGVLRAASGVHEQLASNIRRYCSPAADTRNSSNITLTAG